MKEDNEKKDKRNPDGENKEREKKVINFRGSGTALSNMYRHKITVFGIPVKSSEHAWHWKRCMKAGEEDKAAQILETEDPFMAKRIGDSVRVEWSDQEKIATMEEILRAKLQQVDAYKQELKLSADAYLQENTGDPFWARGKNDEGQNNLGKLHMKLRQDPLVKNFSVGQQDASKVENSKSILLLINSHGRNLREDNFRDASIEKVDAYTIGDAKDCVENMNQEKVFNAVIIHLITNDVTEEADSPAECCDKMRNLVDSINNKFPGATVYISLGLPRGDNPALNKNVNKLNALIFDIEDVHFITNDIFRDKSQKLFDNQKVHLTLDGTRALTWNFKKALGLDTNDSVPRSRSRSRNRDMYRGRGRPEQRGYFRRSRNNRSWRR